MKQLSATNVREWLKLGCEVIAALSALAVAVIAIWGVFFTDLPETLFRQLRSDIAEQNETLVSLHQRRRALEQQLSDARVGVQTAEEKRKQIQEEVDALSREKANLEQRVTALSRERQSYYKNVRKVALDRFFAAVEKAWP